MNPEDLQLNAGACHTFKLGSAVFLLGRMRGSLATLQRLVDIFPDDLSLRNDVGVAHLLLGDNKAAKKVYEEVGSSQRRHDYEF